MTNRTSDFNPRLLAFQLDSKEVTGPIGLDAFKVSPSADEERMIENYFLLMQQSLSRPTCDRLDFKHLIVSLIFRLQRLHDAWTGNGAGVTGTRAKQLSNEFISLVMQQDPPVMSLPFLQSNLPSPTTI